MGSGVPGGAASSGASTATAPGQPPGGGGRKSGGFFKSGGGVAEATAGASAGGADVTPPVEYTMLLHPPLVVENLLPHAGDFELVDQVRPSPRTMYGWHELVKRRRTSTL